VDRYKIIKVLLTPVYLKSPNKFIWAQIISDWAAALGVDYVMWRHCEQNLSNTIHTLKEEKNS